MSYNMIDVVLDFEGYEIVDNPKCALTKKMIKNVKLNLISATEWDIIYMIVVVGLKLTLFYN